MRRTLAVFLVIIAGQLVIAADPTNAQVRTTGTAELARELESILDDDATSNGWWGVAVYDLARNETLFRSNAEHSFIPASNTKLYTTASSLALLGADFRYETELFATGDVKDGVLHGSLVVRGSGDPTFGPRFTDDATLVFRQWADSLKASGIHMVEGDVIGDDDVFDETTLGYGWSWDDEQWWYSAEISGLTYNDNTVDITVTGTKAGSSARVTWEPVSTSYVQIVNASATLASDQPVREDYHRDRGSNLIRVASDVPAGGIEKESVTIANPTLYFVHVLRESLVAAGIAVRGNTRDIDDLSFKPDYTKARRIARHTSHPLSEIVDVVNKVSHNLYAEQLLHTLGARFGEEGSASEGWKAAKPFLASTGIDTTRIQLVDGSGLSRMNLVTPDMTLSLLVSMWRDARPAEREAFLSSLPVGGVDGTLGSRFRNGPARANVRAKTGFVSNASTLSGYVTTAGGSTLAFSVMSNHFTLPTRTSRAVQDRVVQTLASFAR